MFNSQPIKSPLARRLITYTVLFSIFITLLITALQLYRDYNTDIKTIHSELEEIEQVHLSSISAALWATNKNLLKTNIDGIIKIRDMQYIEVRDKQQLWAQAGKKTTGNTIQRRYSINHPLLNKNVNIGELTVIASLEGVYHRLYNKVWVILISNALQISLVAIFIYFLFHHLNTRHLSRISGFLNTRDLLLSNEPLTLDRPKRKPDEFDTLVNSINDMHIRLHEQIEKVNQQRQYLAQTLDSIGDAVISTDTEGNITRMNPVAEKLTGWSINEAHGLSVKKVFNICNAITQEPITNPIEKVIENAEIVHLSNHTTLIAKDGTQYQIADSAAPIKDGNLILGMVLVFNDVTEQYKLRQAFNISEQKYQALTTIAPVGIYYVDQQGQCLYVNEKWCEITGIAPKDAKGDGWTKGLHPSDRQRVLSDWGKLVTEGVAFKCEYRFQQAEEIRWVLGIAQTNTNDLGKIIGYIGSITDITERKRAEAAVLVSEQQLAEAQHMTHIGNWELDLAKSTLKWSDEVYRIFEIDPNKFEASYEIFINATHPDDREKVNTAYSESVKNKTPYTITHRLRMPSGKIKYVEERCKTFYNDKGGPIRSTGTIQDITQQVNIEETLRRSQKMDALGKLTGGIAHDYNNMLGVILGYAALLEDTLSEQPKLAKYANEIHRAGERGSKLTKKLLSFARQKPADTKVININTLLNDEVNILKKSLTSRIKLKYELAEDLWLISIDEDELEDTILNICINAMHAIEGIGQLTIKTLNEQIKPIDAQLLKLEPGEYISLSFADTGHGMDNETKQRIFDPFYTTKGLRGTGLGLSQVYGFMQRSNGTIHVYSELGHGSRFVLYFPKTTQLATKAEIQNSDVEHNEVQGHATLLVVDDEETIRKLAQTILVSFGFKVLTASDGQQAIEILNKELVDLIITDVIMPNMDGYQLASYVQEHYPKIKIQMVSGFADNRHNIDTVPALEKNILLKPYTSGALLTRVHHLLREPSTQEKEEMPDVQTILLVDDEEDIRELFKLNLEKLGYKTISSCDGDEAITLYKQSLENNCPFAAAIIDLSIPGGMNGKEIAQEIRNIDPNTKLIISSGNSGSPEMTNCQQHGFDAAIEKDFNREKMKQVMEQVLSVE
ncbi:diguanylate cyclase/phosphodiesterase (GGDEF & EAL domains) with PAS/PAC sensor(s) [hydrothermal vent metagenome]|uniref:Diguanylate cyclase/phosphodiesterase (GGDEF & EAL domains) with PAS/PAC sensor(S) n=1 Tax=hydrothermal vent metagenome TaxID=652676 RepID=A0A3B1A1F0_9ZZZZ